ncbi:hypothetical protein PtB15_11B336 [Puccinia triticina]|nr:hypothetical protein PtB15_11B336 [Puccinia triticina]
MPAHPHGSGMAFGLPDSQYAEEEQCHRLPSASNQRRTHVPVHPRLAAIGSNYSLHRIAAPSTVSTLQDMLTGRAEEAAGCEQQPLHRPAQPQDSRPDAVAVPIASTKALVSCLHHSTSQIQNMRHWRGIAFVICGLHAVHSSIVHKMGIKSPQSNEVMGTTIANGVHSDTDSWKTSKALKRSREDSSVMNDSRPPSCEASQLKYPAISENKNTRNKIDAVQKVRKCSKETLANFNKWKAAILKLKRARGSRLELQRKIEVLIRSVSKLFEHRITELEGHPANLPDSMLQIWLSSVGDIDRIWESFEPRNSQPARLLIKKGVDLMIQFFVDLQRFEIVPDGRLSHFLNKENQGKLIASYAINGFLRFPLTLADVYTNFNVRLSLQEGPATKKVGELLHC